MVTIHECLLLHWPVYRVFSKLLQCFYLHWPAIQGVRKYVAMFVLMLASI